MRAQLVWITLPVDAHRTHTPRVGSSGPALAGFTLQWGPSFHLPLTPDPQIILWQGSFVFPITRFLRDNIHNHLTASKPLGKETHTNSALQKSYSFASLSTYKRNLMNKITNNNKKCNHRHRIMEQTERDQRGGNGWKKGKGLEKECVWMPHGTGQCGGLTVGVGEGAGWSRACWEKLDSCNRVTIKKWFNKKNANPDGWFCVLF